MTNKDTTYYNPATTDRIVSAIDTMTYEHLYMCRFELIYQYAANIHPDIKVWNDRKFWNWAMRIWEINDLAILDYIRYKKRTKISEAVYLSYQQSMLPGYIPSWWMPVNQDNKTYSSI